MEHDGSQFSGRALSYKTVVNAHGALRHREGKDGIISQFDLMTVTKPQRALSVGASSGASNKARWERESLRGRPLSRQQRPKAAAGRAR